MDDGRVLWRVCLTLEIIVLGGGDAFEHTRERPCIRLIIGGSGTRALRFHIAIGFGSGSGRWGRSLLRGCHLLLPERSRYAFKKSLRVFAGRSSPWHWPGSVTLDELLW